MLKILTVAATSATIALGLATTAQAIDITGAGSTFAAPIYGKWAEGYKAASGSNLNYQSIGSGGGIKQIEAGTVEFGATDMPLSPADLAAHNLAQFPTVTGGVVPIINVPGLAAGQLRLTGPLLASIFLGEITKWNDPRLVAVNKGVALPGLPITVVHRSDGSGTSFIFTSYLSAKSANWKSKVGAGTAVSWPTGLGGKGSEGVAVFTKQTIGSIGYVEYAYALQNHMNYALMQNHQGVFVPPTETTFTAAAAGVNWAAQAPAFNVLLIDEPGAQSWPISGPTFVLINKTQTNPAAGHAALAFFDYGFKNGDAAAHALDYVTLPATAKAAIRKTWATEIKGPDGKPVY
jgi:phosphate transport system substrate-binding protein